MNFYLFKFDERMVDINIYFQISIFFYHIYIKNNERIIENIKQLFIQLHSDCARIIRLKHHSLRCIKTYIAAMALLNIMRLVGSMDD